MITRYRPSLLDHLPKTRRGHGSAHTSGLVGSKENQGQVFIAPTCVQPTCTRNMGTAVRKDGKTRGEAHEDQKANADAWKIEHGFYSLSKRTGEEVAMAIPFEDCFTAGVR